MWITGHAFAAISLALMGSGTASVMRFLFRLYQSRIGRLSSLRMGTAQVLISILEFLMGILFPAGIRWAKMHRQRIAPWLRVVNGEKSAFGSALSTALSIHLSFRVTTVLAALIYGIAGLLYATELRCKTELKFGSLRLGRITVRKHVRDRSL